MSSPKAKIAIGIVIILILTSLAVGLYFAFRPKAPEEPTKKTDTPAETTDTPAETTDTTTETTSTETVTSTGICTTTTERDLVEYANTWSEVNGCNILVSCLAPYEVGPGNTCISTEKLIENLSDVNRMFSNQSSQIQKYILMKDTPAIEKTALLKITGVYSAGALLYLASMHFTSDGTATENTEMINYFKNLSPEERAKELQGTGKYLKTEVAAANTAATAAAAAAASEQSSLTAKSLTSLTTLPTTPYKNLNPVDNKPYKLLESLYPATDSYNALGVKFPIIGTTMHYAGIYSDTPPIYGYAMQVMDGSVTAGPVSVVNGIAYGIKPTEIKYIYPTVGYDIQSRTARRDAVANGPYSLWFKMDGSIQQTDAKGNTTNPTTKVAYFSTKSPELVSGALSINRPYVLSVSSTGKLMISPKNPSITEVGLKTAVEVKIN